MAACVKYSHKLLSLMIFEHTSYFPAGACYCSFLSVLSRQVIAQCYEFFVINEFLVQVFTCDKSVKIKKIQIFVLRSAPNRDLKKIISFKICSSIFECLPFVEVRTVRMLQCKHNMLIFIRFHRLWGTPQRILRKLSQGSQRKIHK